MKTEYLKLALLSNLIETKFDREEHLDANWVLIDEKMKEFQESLEEYEDNVRITLTQEDLAVMAKLVELSQDELTFIAENLLLTEEELELIGEGLTDPQLKRMIESLDFSPTMLALMVAQLTEEQLQEIGGHISVTEEQLAQLVQHLSQEQLTTIGEAVVLTGEQLLTMVEHLSGAQLTEMASNVVLTEELVSQIGDNLSENQLNQIASQVYFTEAEFKYLSTYFTEEQWQKISQGIQLSQEDLDQIGSAFELSDAQMNTLLENISIIEDDLKKMAEYLSQTQLETIGEAVALTGEQLSTMVEELSEAQLAEMASNVVLTEELVSQIGDNLSENQLNQIASQVYFTEAEFKYLSTYFTEEQWQKISQGIQLSQEDLDQIGSAFELSDAQMNTLLENISIIEDDLKKMAEYLSQTQLETISQGVELTDSNLTDIALKVTFTEEQMELLKGEDGGPAEFTEEQILLLNTCIEGLVNKQDRLTNLNRTELVTDSDEFLVIQDGATNILNAVLMAEYIISKSPIPAVGLGLDDYSKADLWAIFNFGQGQNYFKVGDRMTWISNRIVTTAMIAAFNFDVKNHTTGQKANVTFVLNDAVTATSTEVPSIYDASQSAFRAYDVSCLAPVIQLQEGASLYEGVMPEGMKGLITPTIHGRFMSGRFVAADSSTDTLVTMGLFPLSIWEVYNSGATKQTDVVTGESLYTYYPVFTSAKDNLTYLNTYYSDSYHVLRNLGSTSSVGVSYVHQTTGVVTQNSNVTYTNTADWVKSMAVGFCMG